MTRRTLVFLPLILFLALSAVFAVQLIRGGDTSAVPSALIGKPLPNLSLRKLEAVETPVFNSGFIENAPQDIQVVALNVWASWCVPCRAEHPTIEALANIDGVAVVGLNYKDKQEAAAGFLSELGNPYTAIGTDPDGKNGLNLGVYGVPETFLVDRQGVIRTKFVGPLSPERMETEVRPALLAILK